MTFHGICSVTILSLIRYSRTAPSYANAMCAPAESLLGSCNNNRGIPSDSQAIKRHETKVYPIPAQTLLTRSGRQRINFMPYREAITSRRSGGIFWGSEAIFTSLSAYDSARARFSSIYRGLFGDLSRSVR